MKDFITKMTCIILFFVLCMGSLNAQIKVKKCPDCPEVTIDSPEQIAEQLHAIKAMNGHLNRNRAEISDGAEGHASFAVNSPGTVGWQYIDGDGGTTYGIFITGGGQYDFPGFGEPMAFMVFAPGETNPVYTAVPAYSGSKYFIDFNTDQGITNDWMISPMLSSGSDITFSFYARSLTVSYGEERFRAAYSTSGTAQTDFIYLDNADVRPGETWTLYTYTVPASAKYVAVHCKSDDRWALCLDDLYIETAGGGGEGPGLDEALPPEGVSAVVNGDDVRVTWQEPGFVYDGWISHFTGAYYDALGVTSVAAGANMEHYSRWTVADLAALGITAQNKLSKINYYGGSGTSYNSATFVLKIYQGGSYAGTLVPGTLMHEQTLTLPTTGQWNEITLTAPLTIDPTKELWFGISTTATVAGSMYPLSVDAPTNGDHTRHITKWTNGLWHDMLQLGGSDFGTCSFFLQGYITDANGKAITLNHTQPKDNRDYYLDKYAIYCNDNLVGMTTSKNFIHKNAGMYEGTLDYCVTAIYEGDVESIPACVTLDAGGCNITFPYTETFEVGTPASNGCWSSEVLAGTEAWSIVAYNYNSYPATTPSGATGRKAFYTATNYTSEARFITPALDLSCLESATLSFYHVQQAWAGDVDKLYIYYKNAENAEWTPLPDAVWTSALTSWTQRTLTLPDLSGTYYLAFEGRAGYGRGVHLDDVTITKGASLPSPASPTNFTATPYQLSWYNVKLAWDMASTPGLQGFNIYRNGFSLNGRTPVDLSARTYNDLTPGPGTYIYEIEAVGAAGCLSDNKATVTVTVAPDPCDGFVINRFPYDQGFESSQKILELCWSEEIMKGDKQWEIIPSSTGTPSTSHGGGFKARYYYDYQLEQVSRLISPMIDLSEGGGTLSFWYTNASWYLGQDVLRVYYKNSENGSWNLLTTYNENTPNWTQVTMDLPDNTGTYWVCFEGNTNQGYGVQLDDIRINGCALLKELPYAEGFEWGGEMPGCWIQDPQDPSWLWTVEPANFSTPATAHGGSYKLFYEAYDFDGIKNRIMGPRFDLSRQDYDYLKFSFWHAQASWLGDIDALSVAYRTDEEGDWTQLGEWTAAVANWTRRSFWLDNIGSSFRFSFEATGKFGYGVHVDDIEIYPCSNLQVPFEEPFNTEIPICWDNVSLNDLTPWKFVTTGTSPTCTPHSPGGMLQFNSYSSPYTSGTKAQLYTAPINVPRTEEYIEIYFWMYRDAGYATYSNERVNLYVSSGRSIEGLSPLVSVPRAMALAPVVATAGWYQYSAAVATATLSPTTFIVLEAVSQYGNNIYVDDIGAKVYICDDNPVDLPLASSFEGDFPEMCWDLVSNNTSYSWTQVATSSYPSGVLPQDGSQMLRFPSWSSSTLNAKLTTLPFLTGGQDQVLSFWMYRDASYTTSNDRVNIYLTENGDVTGATSVFTAHRRIGQAPVVTAAGWYQFFVLLPCAGMTSAKVTFEGVSGYGNDIYMDNIYIGDVCIPVENVVAEKYGDNPPPPFSNHVMVTWEAPSIALASFTGYNVYRNGTRIANNITALQYDDASNLAPGEYTYCVSALYSNSCGESEQICAAEAIVVIESCTDIPIPADLTATKHVDDWYDVDLNWADPTGVALSYGGDPVNSIGTGAAADFEMAIRLTPEMLAPYNGKKLSKISFVPNQVACTYYLKVYTGGSDMNPGTQVLEQVLNTTDLRIGYIWNTARITSDIIIDASKEMWVGVRCVTTTGHPAGCDGSGGNTIVEDGSSNLMYYDGAWQTMNEAGGGTLPYNWCLKGHIRMVDGNDEVIGYNVYKDDVLLTTPDFLSAAETTYRDRVAGPGTYLYEVSAIYDTFCESEDRAAVTVDMEQSPCESLWEIPIVEGFEGDRFEPLCWETIPGNPLYETPWKRITGAGTSPACTPHSGNSMIQYNSFSSPYTSGRTGLMITPKFVTGTNNYTLKFWMYRDNGYLTNADRVNVYLSETGTIAGLTPILTVNRSMNLAPQVTEIGWYEYTVELNTSTIANGAYVILEGVSAYGNNIYVDDISIIDEVACDKVMDVVVEQPMEGEVHISWTAPLNPGLTGYRVTRDGILIGNDITETYIIDYASIGTHTYCITALFDKPSCTESLPVCFDILVITQCDPVKEVTATVTGERTVEISWLPTASINKTGYTLFRDGEIIAQTEQTTYTDTDVPAGNHTYSVVVNYDVAQKPCAMSDAVNSNAVMVESCEPITNLMSEVSGETVTLTWEYAGKKAAGGNREVVLSENFDSGMPSGWTTIDADGDGHNWIATLNLSWLTSGQGYNGTEGVASYSYNNPSYEPLNPDNWLILPAIEGGGVYELNYKVVTQDAGYPLETYGVYVSTSGTNPTDFTEIFRETLTSKVQGQWHSRNIDLGGYTGTIYVAFRHFNSSDMFMVVIDDVEVVKTGNAITFDIYKDGVFMENVGAMTWEDTGVQTGIYQYCVRPVYTQCTAEDACVTVEIEPCEPINVTNVLVEQPAENAQALKITWEYAGTDAEFEIYRDNNFMAMVTDMTYTDTSVEFDVLYKYCVRPVSAACPGGEPGCDEGKAIQVGIDDAEGEALSIYPNPATTQVTIKGANVVEVEIYNATGQLVEQIKTVEGQTITHVDVAAYEAGTYVFKMRNADKTVTTKSIVVTR